MRDPLSHEKLHRLAAAVVICALRTIEHDGRGYRGRNALAWFLAKNADDPFSAEQVFDILGLSLARGQEIARRIAAGEAKLSDLAGALVIDEDKPERVNLTCTPEEERRMREYLDATAGAIRAPERRRER